MASNQSAVRQMLGRPVTIGDCLGWWGVALTLLLLGAHFFRAGEHGIALGVASVLLFLHSSQTPWKPYAVALVLFWGALEWVLAAHSLALARMQFGMPWLRGSMILMVVALLTGAAAFYSAHKGDAKNAANPGSPALFRAFVFIAAFLALYGLRTFVKPDILLLDRFIPAISGAQIFFAAWYAGFVAEKLTERNSAKMRKRIWLVFSFVFFAQFTLGVLGVDNLLATGALHMPSPAFIIFAPVYRGAPGMMPFLAVTAVLLVGGAWCSALCYFGALDAAAAGKNRIKPLPSALAPWIKHGRAVVLALGVFTALGLRFWGTTMETALAASLVFMAAALGVMAFASRKHTGMLHCTAFCPMGLAVSLVRFLSPWRMRVDRERCTDCGACEAVCAYRAVTKESRAAGKTLFRCALCRDCAGICPNKAIEVRGCFLSPHASRNVFIALVATLHVVFLMTARV